MKPRLEHANLVVRNIDATIAFVTTAFPDFCVRHDGADSLGRRWVHLGTDDAYLALSQASREPAEPWEPYAGRPGCNHLGWEVADAAALRERMREAGYRDSTIPNDHPHRTRVYFYDPDGNDWEFVQYHSADPALRNDYGV